MLKETNTLNPFVMGDSNLIVEMVVSMMPTAPAMSEAERAAFDSNRHACEALYKEARHGALPAGTYRILEQGGIAGWHLELEIDGQEVLLEGPTPEEGRYRVFNDRGRQLADRLARAEIARRHGRAAADQAQFRTVWGGSL